MYKSIVLEGIVKRRRDRHRTVFVFRRQNARRFITIIRFSLAVRCVLHADSPQVESKLSIARHIKMYCAYAW